MLRKRVERLAVCRTAIQLFRNAQQRPGSFLVGIPTPRACHGWCYRQVSDARCVLKAESLSDYRPGTESGLPLLRPGYSWAKVATPSGRVGGPAPGCLGAR